MRKQEHSPSEDSWEAGAQACLRDEPGQLWGRSPGGYLTTAADPLPRKTHVLYGMSQGAEKRPWARGAGQGHPHSQVGAQGWGTHRDGGCTQPGPGALPSHGDIAARDRQDHVCSPCSLMSVSSPCRRPELSGERGQPGVGSSGVGTGTGGRGRWGKVSSSAGSSAEGTEGASSSADPGGGLGTRLRAPGGRTGGSSPGRR